MVGIDVSESSIKVVRLSHDPSYKLLSHCVAPVPAGMMERGIVQDPKAMTKVVLDAMTACDVAPDFKDTMVASIPETQSFLRVIEIPTMEEDEIGEAIQWEVAQHIPFGLENVYIDWQSLTGGHKPAKGHQEILVGAAQRTVVDSLYQVFAGLGLDIAAFELESQALVRSLISGELRSRQGILVVDFGGASTNVVVHDHGTIRFTASLQRGADKMHDLLTEEEDKAVQERPQDLSEEQQRVVAEKLQQIYQELVMEVRGVVEFYNSIDVQHQVKEIIMTGGGANLPGLDRAFLQVFENVHMERGNPWVNIVSGQKEHRTPLDLYQSVRYSTALGLALRPVIV